MIVHPGKKDQFASSLFKCIIAKKGAIRPALFGLALARGPTILLPFLPVKGQDQGFGRVLSSEKMHILCDAMRKAHFALPAPSSLYLSLVLADWVGESTTSEVAGLLSLQKGRGKIGAAIWVHLTSSLTLKRPLCLSLCVVVVQSSCNDAAALLRSASCHDQHFISITFLPRVFCCDSCVLFNGTAADGDGHHRGQQAQH